MTEFIALVAIIISFVSLYRTRKSEEDRQKLQHIETKLAEKELSRIVEAEERENQPTFVVREIGMLGCGNNKYSDYEVKIKICIDNTGCSYLEPKIVILVSNQNGRFLQCTKASLEHIDIREHDRILGERNILIKPGSNLSECKIHIIYIDNYGDERIQEFSIFPEGDSNHPLPSEVRFNYENTYIIKSSPYMWKI